DDDPDWQVYFNLLRAFYKHHTMAIDIAGTVESISKITKETLYKCYNTFYHPSNMAFVICGDVDPEQIGKVIADNQAAKDYERQPDVERLMPEEGPEVNEARVEKKMAVSIPKVQFGYKDLASAGQTGQKMAETEYQTAIGLEAVIGKSSSLFNKLYEQGLVDKAFGWSYDVTPFYSHSLFGGKSKDPERLLEEVEQAFAEVVEQGITEADFNRARNKMIGQVLAIYDSPRMLARYYTTYVTRQANVFDVIPILEAMTVEQVNERLRAHIRPEYRAVSIVRPSE
ncbi:MAG TPA: pitrilysin family protein, partial [Bacilli bacterium]|nr:pitrilysin family protein [Bacilli bacterium]